ncbi:MAG: hypothetical protein JST59_01410 [Actinobacteria bacterium]|nr:hypothetical protein [Actinomycetota bacterium]
MSNTISTLSNLLRHSNAYLKDLTANKIVQRILDIIRVTKSQNILVFGLNFLQKAVQYPEFVGQFREEILGVVRGLSVGPSEGEASKKLKKIMEKL